VRYRPPRSSDPANDQIKAKTTMKTRRRSPRPCDDIWSSFLGARQGKSHLLRTERQVERERTCKSVEASAVVDDFWIRSPSIGISQTVSVKVSRGPGDAGSERILRRLLRAPAAAFGSSSPPRPEGPLRSAAGERCFKGSRETLGAAAHMCKHTATRTRQSLDAQREKTALPRAYWRSMAW
jgi:hypothetical protein